MEDFVEPGAVRHGNFINYYEFNSAKERLELLPIDDKLWKIDEAFSLPFLVLDIGCNSGDFTQIFYEFLQNKTKRKVIMLGIDIDSILIHRATEKNLYRNNIFYQCSDVMHANSGDNIQRHLQQFGVNHFDVISCMSVTMWIHLNNGDDGLKKFLNIISGLSTNLIIEPQPWKCYRNAVRRMKRAGSDDTFPLFNELKMRNDVENDIKTYLQNEFELKICYESDPTKWKRKICFYKNANI